MSARRLLRNSGRDACAWSYCDRRCAYDDCRLFLCECCVRFVIVRALVTRTISVRQSLLLVVHLRLHFPKGFADRQPFEAGLAQQFEVSSFEHIAFFFERDRDVQRVSGV